MSNENEPDFLPSARRAMRMAVELASKATASELDLERAHLWIAIARELRIGARPTGPIPRPLERAVSEQVAHLGDDSLLPICGAVGPDDPEGALVFFDRRDVNCLACLRAEPVAVERVEHVATLRDEDRPQLAERLLEAARYLQVQVPVPEPSGRTDETAVMQGFELPNCAYCDNALVWVTPGPESPEQGPHWSHYMTGQRVCPVSAPDQQHTFATPMVDARG